MSLLQLEEEAILEYAPGKLDPQILGGQWINTNSHTRGVQELTIEVDRDQVSLRAFSAGADGLCAWGATRADLICGADVSAKKGMAFTARYDFGAFQVELQGNLNLGLLVIASFNRVGAMGHDYFAREFYRRGERAVSSPSTPWNSASGQVGGDDPNEVDRAAPGLPFDGSELFGEWWNTNPDSKGISRLQIGGSGGNAAAIRLWEGQVPDPLQREPIEAALFALSSGSPLAKAFSARYEANDVAVKLQANIKQGVLVVASFTEFTEGDERSNYFHREFYYRR